ncbi:MAG: TonB-dependent receptor [Pseudomonadales bacterium]
MTRILCWQVLLCLVVSPYPAMAADDSGGPKLEEIVVSARTLAGSGGRTAAVAVLDEETLTRIRPTHAAEALSTLPGVWVTRGSGQEHLTAIRSATLSGAGSCGSFLMLEDGIPIRPTGFCNVNNLFELNVEQAAALEVWRGPGSAALGGNALKGAINVQSRLPEANRVGLERGAYGYGQVRVDARADLGDFAWGVTANGTNSDGYQDQTGYEQYKLNSVLDGMVGDWHMRATLAGTLLHQETGGYVLGTDAYKHGSLRRANPNPEAYRDAWSGRVAVQFDKDAWTITPYARRSMMTFIQHFLPGKPTEDNDQTSVGLLVTRDFRFDALNVRTGLQGEMFSGGLKEDQSDPTIGSAFLVATRPQGIHYDYEVDGGSLAAFYDVDWRFAERFHLVHSARAEWLKYDYDNLALDGNTKEDGSPCGFGGCLYTRPADSDDDFTNVAGRLGMGVDLNADARAHVTLGTGFRPPQAVELYRLQSGQRVADLDSERVVSLEAGYANRWLNVVAFAERTRNMILRDSSGFNVSNGRTKSHGLELGASHAFGDHDVDLSLTWARHRYDFDRALGGGETINKGDDVDTAPRFMGYARWGWRLSDTLRQEFDVNWMGKYYANADNTSRYDGHVVVNWRGEWQAMAGLRLFVRVMNLFDEKYADRADFAFGNDRYFVAMPRQFYAGVDYTFQ